jgi:hypothetical protein
MMLKEAPIPVIGSAFWFSLNFPLSLITHEENIYTLLKD